MTVVLAKQPVPVEPTWAATGFATAFALAIAVVVFALVKSARGGIRGSDDFLLAGRKVGVGQNALAMVGGCIMYSTVIIVTGHIALNGFDAIVLLTSFTLSTVVALLVYAGPVRNVGGHTLGDLFALRARERQARMASAVLNLLVYTMFTIIGIASIGLVTHRLFSNSTEVNKPLVATVVAVVGLAVIAAVYAGGMAGVTRMLVLKAVLMIALMVTLAIVVMAKYKLNVFHLLDDANAHAAPDKGGRGHSLLDTGRLFDKGSTVNSDQDPWVHMSKTISVTLGVMGMPFLFMRNFVARSGTEARQSAGRAALIIVAFWQFMIIVGIGAIAILGRYEIGLLPEHRDITIDKLADNLGGGWAVGALGGVALLSVSAIFAALLINAVTSITKDLNAARGRQPDPGTELKAIRRNVLVLGIGSLVFGMAMMTQLTHIFIPTSIDIGAACVLPAVVYSLFWRRFNTRGLQWTIYGGIAVTLLMVAFSNGVSGDPTAIFADSDFKIIDFEPGVLGAPLGFLFGYLGSVTSSERNDAAFVETQVRALTGAVVPARKTPPARSAETGEPESRTPSEAH
jgi:cation/acetate symporter